jgi:hypothetical protein
MTRSAKETNEIDQLDFASNFSEHEEDPMEMDAWKRLKRKSRNRFFNCGTYKFLYFLL